MSLLSASVSVDTTVSRTSSIMEVTISHAMADSLIDIMDEDSDGDLEESDDVSWL